MKVSGCQQCAPNSFLQFPSAPQSFNFSTYWANTRRNETMGQYDLVGDNCFPYALPNCALLKNETACAKCDPQFYLNASL